MNFFSERLRRHSQEPERVRTRRRTTGTGRDKDDVARRKLEKCEKTSPVSSQF